MDCFVVVTDIAFSSGKVGDYLLLGNFVYSVSLLYCHVLSLGNLCYDTVVSMLKPDIEILISSLSENY